MKIFKNKFAEFKSIFVTDDILKENEQHANVVTASTMINLFWICLITWIIVYLEIFKIELTIMTSVLLFSLSLLLIPALICYMKKGEGSWLKHFLFISFTIMLAFADMLLKYNVTLVMVIPIILAARYYNKKFTLFIGVFTSLLFILSAFLSVKVGQQDLNSYNLVIPKGTEIKVDSTLRKPVEELKIDENERLKNIFIHFFIPKMLIFNIVAFACIQISQSGKKLIKKQEEITKSNERIDTELNLASAIQMNMLPEVDNPFPEHNEIDIYASMTPAKEVGGDFYDMFLIDDDHLAICMADVSGKGIPASLFMMISKILIKNVSKMNIDITETFTKVNNMLCDGNKTDIFVTCWFGILNLKNGKLNFVNAGHNPPLLYSKKINKFDYLKTKPNFVLGGMKDTKYDKYEIDISEGDRLFLYTDGIVEANNIKNELYGETRLLAFLNSNIDLSVKETIIEIKKDIDIFVAGNEQFDDITMLELLYKNNNINKREFKANRYELPNIQRFVKEEVSKQNCDPKVANQISLAIEEMFVNIADYAYQGKKGNCFLTIEFNDNKFTFTFEDEGIPFNPIEKENPNINLPVQDRKVGGLGIYITKTIMDEVKYKYENNKNILTLIIDIDKKED